MAMIFGHLSMFQEHVNQLMAALLGLLDDERVFVKSWVIVSLCIVARIYPDRNERITSNIAPLATDESVAIRSRTRKAMVVLTDENAQFPKGWVKSEHLLDTDYRL